MQHLDTLWKMVTAASTVRDLALESKTYQFVVQPRVTVYVHTEYAAISITRWHQPLVTMKAQLQAGFGWRVETDQDEAGVYLVAKRRAVVGGLGRGRFDLHVPYNAYLHLKLEKGQLTLDDISGEYTLPPVENEKLITLAPDTP